MSAAHRLAIENPKIKADMIEATTFTPQANKYEVQGVPRSVINGKVIIDGAQPIEEFISAIEEL